MKTEKKALENKPFIWLPQTAFAPSDKNKAHPLQFVHAGWYTEKVAGQPQMLLIGINSQNCIAVSLSHQATPKIVCENTFDCCLKVANKEYGILA